MKRWALLFVAFSVVGGLLCGMYYYGYQRAVENLNVRLEKQNAFAFLDTEKERLPVELTDGNVLGEKDQEGQEIAWSGRTDIDPSGNPQTDPKKNLDTGSDTDLDLELTDTDILQAGSISSDKIMPYTAYQIESYDVATDTYSTEVFRAPADLVGLGRTEVEKYLQNYLENLPLSEYRDGLASVELTQFSKQQITVRKFYNSALVPYQYYLVVRDGLVVVYYCDRKTVYEYTQIRADSLPIETQTALSRGIGVEDAELLYSILEGYSS